MMAGMRVARVTALAVVGVLVAASPAGATTVVANQQYAWFYWLAPILAGAALLMIFGLWGGYIRKILIPKYRGRKVRD
jgi:glycerol uptake facilitator-like aquaporin